jgi:hypothetical protein
MTETSIAAAHVATNDLRVGSVISRSGAVLSRHFLPFFIVAAIADSPTLLIASMQTTEPIEPSEAGSQALWAVLGAVLRVCSASSVTQSSCTRRFRTCAAGRSGWSNR